MYCAVSPYVSLRHSLIVLSFSNAAEAMMFSVGWQAQQRTTSATLTATRHDGVNNKKALMIIKNKKKSNAKTTKCNKLQKYS